MTTEANSYYNAAVDNCGEAVDDIFTKYGLNSGENLHPVFSSDGFSTLIGPGAEYPLDPNSLYENTINNNQKRFLKEIIRK